MSRKGREQILALHYQTGITGKQVRRASGSKSFDFATHLSKAHWRSTRLVARLSSRSTVILILWFDCPGDPRGHFSGRTSCSTATA